MFTPQNSNTVEVPSWRLATTASERLFTESTSEKSVVNVFTAARLVPAPTIAVRGIPQQSARFSSVVPRMRAAKLPVALPISCVKARKRIAENWSVDSRDIVMVTSPSTSPTSSATCSTTATRIGCARRSGRASVMMAPATFVMSMRSMSSPSFTRAGPTFALVPDVSVIVVAPAASAVVDVVLSGVPPVASRNATSCVGRRMNVLLIAMGGSLESGSGVDAERPAVPDGKSDDQSIEQQAAFDRGLRVHSGKRVLIGHPDLTAVHGRIRRLHELRQRER